MNQWYDPPIKGWSTFKGIPMVADPGTDDQFQPDVLVGIDY